MNLQSLNMLAQIKEKYSLSPLAVMSYEFDSEGDIKKSQVFLKRLNQMTPVLEELYTAQHKIYMTLNEMPVIFKLGFSKVCFNALAPIYSQLDKNIKEFKRVLKKGSSFTEVVEFFKEAEAIFDVNVYEMMKSDFAEFQPTVDERMAVTKATYTNFDLWDSTEVDWVVVNQRYKEAK